MKLCEWMNLSSMKFSFKIETDSIRVNVRIFEANNIGAILKKLSVLGLFHWILTWEAINHDISYSMVCMIDELIKNTDKNNATFISHVIFGTCFILIVDYLGWMSIRKIAMRTWINLISRVSTWLASNGTFYLLIHLI